MLNRPIHLGVGFAVSPAFRLAAAAPVLLGIVLPS